MDTSLAASLLLTGLGAKLIFEAARMLRSSEVRAIEDKVTFFENSASLTKTDSRRFCLVMGLVGYCLAWLQYVSPQLPPFTGRWSWVYSLVHQNLGSYGMVLLWVIVGNICLFAAAKPPKS